MNSKPDLLFQPIALLIIGRKNMFGLETNVLQMLNGIPQIPFITWGKLHSFKNKEIFVLNGILQSLVIFYSILCNRNNQQLIKLRINYILS